MITVDFRLHLQEFQVRRRNEGSPDEPFLWVVGIKFDGVTSGHLLADGFTPEAVRGRARRAKLEFFTPPGRHGNLGPAADDVDHRRPIPIPRSLGLWDTQLQIDVPEPVDGNTVLKDPPALAALANVAMIVVALEEDGTKDSHAIEVHRRVMKRVEERATAVLREVLLEAIDSVFDSDLPVPTVEDVRERLAERLNPRAVRRIIERFKDDVVPWAVLRTFVNLLTLPATIAQADPDDNVGWRSVDYSLPRIIANAVDGFQIDMSLNQDRSLASLLEDLGAELTEEVRERLRRELIRSEEGNYHVSGRAYRTDLREPPTLGAIWQPSLALVVGRGNERGAFGSGMSDTGDRRRWRRLGAGVFTSGLAAASSLDGDEVMVVGRGTDNRVWLGRAEKGLDGFSNMGWRPTEPLQSRYGAGVAYARQADRVHVFAVDEDHRVRWSWSKNKGDGWTLPWGYCGQAVLDSSPAATITNRGEHLNVFGLGRDRNIWRAYAPDGGTHWSLLWSRSGIPDGPFDSAPAVAMSIDGRRLFLCAKQGGRLFVLRSDDFGQTWSKDGWRRLGLPDFGEQGDGFFISAPAVCASPDFKEVHVFAVASNLGMYWRRVVGDEWSSWQRMGDRLFA